MAALLRDASTLMNAQDEPLSIEAAGRAAGISPRTLRSWIVHGKLPAVGGQRGKLVRLADVLAVSGTDENRSALRRAEAVWERSGTVEPAETGSQPPPHPAIGAILDELRDGVLWPLAERVELLARENGRLAAEHDAAVRARDEAVARFDSDTRFVDDLVSMLQADLAVARRRIAELEARPEADGVVGRLRAELASAHRRIADLEARTAQDEPAVPVPPAPADASPFSPSRVGRGRIGRAVATDAAAPPREDVPALDDAPAADRVEPPIAPRRVAEQGAAPRRDEAAEMPVPPLTDAPSAPPRGLGRRRIGQAFADTTSGPMPTEGPPPPVASLPRPTDAPAPDRSTGRSWLRPRSGR
ncbi:MAG: hypothetical protein QOJ59_1045 [Thermomicrobiales bacterium]|nr:hypothetical protein [Thermomicrobiales bacterium]